MQTGVQSEQPTTKVPLPPDLLEERRRAQVTPRNRAVAARPSSRDPSRSFLPILERRLVAHLVVLLVLVVCFLAATVVAQSGPTPTNPPDRNPAVPGPSVEALVLLYGCWTGQAPRDAPIPQHAVVTLPGRPPALVPSDVGFAIWLGPDGTPRTGDERPGIVSAFCP